MFPQQLQHVKNVGDGAGQGLGAVYGKLAISSRDRFEGTSTDFSVRFHNKITARALQITSFSFANTLDNLITGRNDKIYFTVGGTSYTAQLSRGCWNAESLANEIVSAMTAEIDNSWLVTFSGDSQRVTFSGTLDFELAWTSAPLLAKMLGFAASDLTGSNSYSGVNTYNLNLIDFLFIDVGLCSNSVMTPSGRSFDFCVLADTVQGSYSIVSNVATVVDKGGQVREFDELHVRMSTYIDGVYEVVNNNSCDWSFILDILR